MGNPFTWKAISPTIWKMQVMSARFSEIAITGCGSCQDNCFTTLSATESPRLAEFLDDDLTEIDASAHQSPRLRNLGGQEVLDELRVMIRDKSGTTAFFCFSTQIQPGLSQFRICGPRNSIVVDQVSGSLIRNEKRSYKSYLTFFIPPLQNAREHLRNARQNLLNFVGRKLYQDSGMTELISRFYQSIRFSAPPPIPYREISLTARIMDEIFSQIYSGNRVPKQEQTECSVI